MCRQLNSCFCPCHSGIFAPALLCLLLLCHFGLPAPATGSQAAQVFIWFYVSFRQVSFNHLSWGHIPELSTESAPPHQNLWFSKKQTKGREKKSRSTKILKRGRELITNFDHIFPERSLHEQMAALCCSANVPCHNSAWFSSSISFILESHPLIWHWETFPLALTPYQSHQQHATTMRAAPVLITASADKMKNKAAASSILISNPGWHKQVHGDDTNKLEEKERVTGRAITLRRVEEEWHSIWSCQHSSLSLSLTLHTNTPTHTHLMSAKEPREQGEVAVKSISSWE